jgi:hypothetical protein
MLIDVGIIAFIRIILARAVPLFKTIVQSLFTPLHSTHAIASAAERLRSDGLPGHNPLWKAARRFIPNQGSLDYVIPAAGDAPLVTSVPGRRLRAGSRNKFP